MNFAVPDGHVGDECLDPGDGPGVAERAPYPRIAEVVSGMVEFIAEASRVWNAHWRTLPRSGLVPLRSAFEPLAVPALLPHMLICALTEPTLVRIRLVGTGMATNFGFEPTGDRSEEHTSELQSLMRISYAVFCLQKKKQ